MLPLFPYGLAGVSKMSVPAALKLSSMRPCALTIVPRRNAVLFFAVVAVGAIGRLRLGCFDGLAGCRCAASALGRTARRRTDIGHCLFGRRGRRR